MMNQILVNNNELGKIRDSISQYNKNTDNSENKFIYSDKKNEDLMLNNWKESKNQKIINSRDELSRQDKYTNDEIKTLKEAVSNNVVIANILESQRQMPLMTTKQRISEINDNSFREKEILVNKLIYIIYFILFSIGLAIALVSGMISIRILVINLLKQRTIT